MTPASVDSKQHPAVHVEFEYGALREVIDLSARFGGGLRCARHPLVRT